MGVLVAVLLLMMALEADAGTPRNPVTVREFRKTHPCPHTGLTTGPCAGYVVDHKVPLCADGADSVANMMWMATDAAQAKDRLERDLCRCRASHKENKP